MNAAIQKTSEFAARQHVRLAAVPLQCGFAIGTEDLLVKALSSLLEIAVKFSNPGAPVRITSQRISNFEQISIAANGGVIPESVLARFFDVFSVGEETAPNGGVGLGGALAHRILSLFGGSVRLENRDSSGIEMTVSFRCAALLKNVSSIC
jgi:two-component system sensor histidine kinase KdpD